MGFWSVFWEAALTGKVILVMSFSIIGGYFVGFGIASVVGRILAFCGFFVIAMVMLATSTAFGMLTQLHRVGAISYSGSIMATLQATMAVLFVLCMWFGVFARKNEESELEGRVAILGPEHFFEQISILYANPRMATGGWFTDRWAPMSRQERLEWCDQHLAGLRALQRVHPDGFGAFNPILASQLAQLDLEKKP
ncbi:hypothetical protein GEU84_005325 [Fertoebacter nigrum]|uniref:Uncharacterized protein n=1 Tax=Fertoeibacter niger TaxID=2656921 RepID=A0A8X8GXT0_9RHOB|nr:hypothetical protein [Fertoeibacter niger]NUB43798.1 hypothetical protein [Fertoeibacter niger]